MKGVDNNSVIRDLQNGAGNLTLSSPHVQQKSMRTNDTFAAAANNTFTPAMHGQMIKCDFPQPKFASFKQETWKWLFAPLFVYLLERLFRLYRAGRYSATIVDVVNHENDVMQLKLKLKGFKVKPGQSIGVRCPSVSSVEVHPFSVTRSCKASGGTNCEIFIKVCGDWTSAFKEVLDKSNEPNEHETRALYSRKDDEGEVLTSHNDSDLAGVSESSQNDMKQKREYAAVIVEGPFTSPLQSVLSFKKALCIGGGIGITPFISVVIHLLFRSKKLKSIRLQRLELMWICRDMHDFKWFADAVQELKSKVWAEEVPDLFSVSFYYTGKDEEESTSTDFNSSLLQGIPLKRGRPDMEKTFNQYAQMHPRSHIGVFCCGPSGLISAVKKCCEKNYPNRAVFKLHKESFT